MQIYAQVNIPRRAYKLRMFKIYSYQVNKSL